MHNYENVLKKAAEKFRRTAELARQEGILPYKSADGKWITSPYDGNSFSSAGPRRAPACSPAVVPSGHRPTPLRTRPR